MMKGFEWLKEIVAPLATKKFPGTLALMARPKTSLSVNVDRNSIEIVDRKTRQMICISRANAVYLVDMMNYFEYFFTSAEPIIVKRRNEIFHAVDFSTPRYQHISGFDDFPVYCPSLTEPFITTRQYLDFANLQPGSIVFDLGCYSALTSIAFSKCVGEDGLVVAMEPDPENFAAATKNVKSHLRINGLSNIHILNAAVHANHCKLEFSAEGAMGSAVSNIVGGYRGHVIEVEAYGLMDLAKRFTLGSVDFIKMDIEGAEEKVLMGAKKFFEHFRPKIIIEPHLVDGVLSDKAVISLLESYNYRCEVIEQFGVNLPLVLAVPAEQKWVLSAESKN